MRIALATLSPSDGHWLTRAALLVALVGLGLFPCGGAATPWGEVRLPSAGATRVIGSVSNGCIAGAQMLPETGTGFVSIRRYRNRYYGHPTLIQFIAEIGRTQQRHRGMLILVGDLSQPRGGLMSSSHRSHQNGLDVDLWFTLAASPVEARQLMDNQPDPPSMVSPDGLSVSQHWGADQRFLIETVAHHPLVDRLFVNAAIKREICQSTHGDRGWLRKVRPWKGHDAHFHVRLVCPADSPQCDAQTPLPPGDGCGSELDWWLTPEARQPIRKKPSPSGPEPVISSACQAVLHDAPTPLESTDSQHLRTDVKRSILD